MLDLCPPSSLLLANDQGNIKNVFAAYSTELITKLPKVNDNSTLAPNPEPENSIPLASELLTAPEAPEHLQLPMPEQGNLYAVDVPAHPVSETTPNEVSDAAFDEFLAQLNDWQNAHSGPSAPTQAVQHTIDNALMPTPTSFPMSVAQYTVGNIAMPTPISFPPPVVQFMVDSVPVPTAASLPSYEYTLGNAPYGYPTTTMAFDAQFLPPYSYAAPDMDFYPHPQVDDQTYFYPASAATNVLPMQGLYTY